MRWKPVVALLLALSLLLTGCGLPTIRRIDRLSSSASSSAPSSASSSAPVESEPESVLEPAPDVEEPLNAAWLREREELLAGWESFDDITYERPDLDALGAKIADLTARAAFETDADDFFEAYESVNAGYQHYATMYSLLSLQHDLDVNDETFSDEIMRLSEYEEEMIRLTSDLFDAIFSNPVLTAWCEENWAPATVRYARSLCYTDAENDSSAEETELLLEYDRLQSNFSISVEGEEWTLDDFQSYDGTGALDIPSFYRYYALYLQAYNAAAGELFLQLRDLRVQEAKNAGYDNYADYQYMNYGCDYGSDDLEGFCEAVKTYIAPLFEELYWSLYTEESERMYAHAYSLDETLVNFGDVLSEVSPSLSDSYELMLSRGLYDCEPSAVKSAGAYTTFFYDYGVPFIFSSFTGSYWDVSTIIHEFGHFSSMARTPRCRLEEIDSIDLAEIDSQGLELLLFPYYDRMFTSDLADAARNEVLLNMMSALLSGCMEDEFQRAVYANPDMTLEEVNALYEELAWEYGQGATYGTDGYSWTLIHHTFSAPMYYISYALSAVSALELWSDAQTDWSGAFEKYLDFIDERGHQYSYREALATFGFADPLEESDQLVSEIAAKLARYAYTYDLNGEEAA